MSEYELQAQLSAMSKEEKHIALSALITITVEDGGFFLTEQNMKTLFTETQQQVSEARERLGLKE